MREIQVKDAIKIINGFSFESNLFNKSKVGLPVARIRNVTKGFSETFYSGEYSEQYIIDNGAVLVGMDGEFNIAVWKGGKALLNQRVCRILPKPEIVNETYIRYHLSVLLKEIEENTPFVTVKHLSSEKLKKEKLLIPPHSEQERIAALLDKADRLRRLRRFALEMGDSYLQSVFLEMFGDPVTNPMGWEEVPFGKLCAIDAEMVDPRRDEYKRLLHIGGANIKSVTGKLVNLITAEKEGLISGKFLVTPELILFSKIRPKLRKVAFPRMRCLCSADIYPIRVTSSRCNILYLLHWLRSPQFTSIVAERAEARAQIPKVNRVELSRISIPVPDTALQEKFAQVVKSYERLRSQQRESLRQAEHLFQSLLKSAFEGGL